MMIEVSRPPEYASATFFTFIFVSSNACDFPKLLSIYKDAALKERRKNCLLGVESVFCLIEDPALMAFDDLVCNLFASMGREAVQEDCLGVCKFHQLFVYLVTCKGFSSFFHLFFLTHGGP